MRHDEEYMLLAAGAGASVCDVAGNSPSSIAAAQSNPEMTDRIGRAMQTDSGTLDPIRQTVWAAPGSGMPG